jgi:hypothetical protein
MRESLRGLRVLASWYGYVARYYARETWRAIPGPWWVKVLLIAVCTAIPGPGDEIGLIAITAWSRRRAAKKLAEKRIVEPV